MKRNTEIWKDIKGFPGYQISCFGRCKSPNKILKTIITEKGYHRIDLRNNNKRKSKKIHILVITHFGEPKPSPEYECNHKDGDKRNNWNTNLEWMTHQENVQHSYDIGLSCKKGELNGNAKLSNKKVLQIRKLYKSNNYTQTELALSFRVSITTISGIINYTIWKEVK